MKPNELALATGRVQPIEDGTFAIIFKKADDTPTKRNEYGVRMTQAELAELLKDCQSALFSQFKK